MLGAAFVCFLPYLGFFRAVFAVFKVTSGFGAVAWRLEARKLVVACISFAAVLMFAEYSRYGVLCQACRTSDTLNTHFLASWWTVFDGSQAL